MQGAGAKMPLKIVFRFSLYNYPKLVNQVHHPMAQNPQMAIFSELALDIPLTYRYASVIRVETHVEVCDLKIYNVYLNAFIDVPDTNRNSHRRTT